MRITPASTVSFIQYFNSVYSSVSIKSLPFIIVRSESLNSHRKIDLKKYLEMAMSSGQKS